MVRGPSHASFRSTFCMACKRELFDKDGNRVHEMFFGGPHDVWYFCSVGCREKWEGSGFRRQ